VYRLYYNFLKDLGLEIVKVYKSGYNKDLHGVGSSGWI
jgi:hypothetical protein